MEIKNKKILHIIIGLNVGGAELMLKRLIVESRKRQGIEHVIISLTELGVVGSELRELDFKVYTLNIQSMINLLLGYLKLKKIIQKIQPDVVQTWMYHADFLGGLAAKRLGIQQIIWGIRTTAIGEGTSRLTLLLRRLCAISSYKIPKQIICAAYASKVFHETLGYDSSKMRVIPNGFDLNKLSATDEERQQLRQSIDISKQDIVIGSLGRFNAEKNPKLFVDTAYILIQKRPNLKFIMVGRDNDNNNSILMNWLKYYNLQENFRLLGQRSDVAHCLKAMDIFCLHSRTEGFPNVLGEAMAVGVPCVTVDVGDAKYIVNDLGRVVPPNDADQLARAILDTIEQLIKKPKKLEFNQIKSRQYIENNFSMEKIYQSYNKIWQS